MSLILCGLVCLVWLVGPCWCGLACGVCFVSLGPEASFGFCASQWESVPDLVPSTNTACSLLQMDDMMIRNMMEKWEAMSIMVAKVQPTSSATSPLNHSGSPLILSPSTHPPFR